MIKLYDMPKSLFDKWLTALRSGDYKRGVGELCKPEIDDEGDPIDGTNTYCCLGVLNDIAGGDFARDDGEEFLQPDTFGLSEDIQKTLANINDTVHATTAEIDTELVKSLCVGLPDCIVDLHKTDTFHQIADYIEANLQPAD